MFKFFNSVSLIWCLEYDETSVHVSKIKPFKNKEEKNPTRTRKLPSHAMSVTHLKHISTASENWTEKIKQKRSKHLRLILVCFMPFFVSIRRLNISNITVVYEYTKIVRKIQIIFTSCESSIAMTDISCEWRLRSLCTHLFLGTLNQLFRLGKPYKM